MSEYKVIKTDEGYTLIQEDGDDLKFKDVVEAYRMRDELALLEAIKDTEDRINSLLYSIEIAQSDLKEFRLAYEEVKNRRVKT